MTDDIIFPKGFLWGSATSAHQVEGNNTNNHFWSWEQEGGHIADGSLSGKACDQYNRYKEDILLLKTLGHQCYRFSIEWSRIEPQQHRGKRNNQRSDQISVLPSTQMTEMYSHRLCNQMYS